MPEPGTLLPEWATDGNYSPSVYPAEYPWPEPGSGTGREAHPEAGNPTPWSNTARRNATSLAAFAANGWDPGEPLPAEQLNAWLGLASEWITWVSENEDTPDADSHLIKTDASGHARILKVLAGASDAAATVFGVIGLPSGGDPVALIDLQDGTSVASPEAALNILLGTSRSHVGLNVDHHGAGQRAILGIARGDNGIGVQAQAEGLNSLGLFVSSADYHGAQFAASTTHAPVRISGIGSDPSNLVLGGVSYNSSRQQLRTPNHVNATMHSLMTSNRGWHSFIQAAADSLNVSGGEFVLLTQTIKNPIVGTTYLIHCEVDVRRNDQAAADATNNWFEIAKDDGGGFSDIRDVGFHLKTAAGARGQGHSCGILITAANTNDIDIQFKAEVGATALDFLTPRMTIFGDLSDSVV